MGLCCYISEKGNPRNSFNLGKMYGYARPNDCDKFDSLLLLIKGNRCFYEYMLNYINDGDATKTDYTVDDLYGAALHIFENGIYDTDALFPFENNDDCSVDKFVMQYIVEYAKYGFLPETANYKLNEYFEWRKSIKSDPLCISFS